MRKSTTILVATLLVLALNVQAGPAVTTEYICNSFQGNVWFEEATHARLLEAELVPEVGPTAFNPKPSVEKPTAEKPVAEKTPEVKAEPVVAEKPVAVEKPAVAEKPAPAQPEAKKEDAPVANPADSQTSAPKKEEPVPKKDAPVAPKTETPAAQPEVKVEKKKEDAPVAPAEKKPEETPVELPKKAPYPKPEFSVRVKMQAGLPQEAIKAGCVAQLEKVKPVASHGTKFYVVLAIAFGLVLGVLLALSAYYKNHLNKYKQAPFAVPQWMPEAFFPKFDFYYEQEMTNRMRRERLRDEDEI